MSYKLPGAKIPAQGKTLKEFNKKLKNSDIQKITDRYNKIANFKNNKKKQLAKLGYTNEELNKHNFWKTYRDSKSRSSGQ